MSTILLLGNVAPVGLADPRPGGEVTLVSFPDGAAQPDAVKLSEQTDRGPENQAVARLRRLLRGDLQPYALAVRDVEATWPLHASDGPSWVSSDDEAFARAVAAFFKSDGYDEPEVIPFEDGVRRRTDAEPGPGLLPPIGGGSVDVDRLLDRMGLDVLDVFGARFREQALITNAGTDLVLNASFGTAAQPAAANQMAVTANTTPPVSGDTTLTGEIATAGGGLLRGAATYAHTTGTNTATLTRTLTANGSDALPVTLGKLGVFNAASGGSMAIATLITPTATLSAAGDNVTITDTITRS